MKKCTLLISILWFCALSFCYGQNTFVKAIGGSGYENGTAAIQTHDGGFVALGNIYGAINYDIYLIKTNSIGNLLWTKVFIGAFDGSSGETATIMKETSDGGLILVGGTDGFGAGLYDFYILKLDSLGNTVWAKTYGNALSNFANSIDLTSDGGYIVCGTTANAGNVFPVLMKIDANGVLLWTKNYQIPGANFYSGSVKQTIDKGYLLSGSYRISSGATSDAFIIKTDSVGNFNWGKSYGGSNNEIGIAAQTPDSGFIIGGSTNSFGIGGSDLFLLKTDGSGNIIWTKTYGGIYNDYFDFLIQTYDSGYLVGGSSDSPNAISFRFYSVKTDENGDTLWSRLYVFGPMSGYNAANRTSDGGFIMAGNVNGFALGSDVGLIKTNNLGNSGCYQNNFTNTISTPVFNVDSIFPVASSEVFFETSPPTYVNSGGSMFNYCSSLAIDDQTLSFKRLNLYPNPAHGNTIIYFGERILVGHLSLFNVYGEKVVENHILNQSKMELSLDRIPPGIYFVKVFDGVYETCAKVIVE